MVSRNLLMGQKLALKEISSFKIRGSSNFTGFCAKEVVFADKFF